MLGLLYLKAEVSVVQEKDNAGQARPLTAANFANFD